MNRIVGAAMLAVGCLAAGGIQEARSPGIEPSDVDLGSPGVTGNLGCVAGQVFAVAESGETMLGAGAFVLMLPKNERWDEKKIKSSYNTWIHHGKEYALDEIKKAHGDNVWLERSDAEGRFSFDYVVPGNYVIASGVWWKDPGDRGGADSAAVHVIAGRRSVQMLIHSSL